MPDRTDLLIEKIDKIESEFNSKFAQLSIMVSREDQTHDEIRDKLSNVEQSVIKIETKMEQIASVYPIVLDPREGLVLKVHDLENFRKSSKKVYWTLFTSLIGIASAVLIATLT